MSDYCIFCGAYVPDGRQICPVCESMDSDELISYLNRERGKSVFSNDELLTIVGCCEKFDCGGCLAREKKMCWAVNAQIKEKFIEMAKNKCELKSLYGGRAFVSETYNKLLYCTQCKSVLSVDRTKKYNFCPICGADARVRDE